MSKKVNNYINENNLQKSYIKPELLYQIRPTLPETKIVAKTDDFMVMFEETAGSVRNRHYKYDREGKKPTFNLLFIDNNGTRLFDYEDVAKIENIELQNGYTVIDIERFLNTDNKRKNGVSYRKTGRKSVIFYITDEEKELIKKFIEKMREVRGWKVKEENTYFENLFYGVLKSKTALLNGLKTKEDTEKIYTLLGYIDKKKLERTNNENNKTV